MSWLLDMIFDAALEHRILRWVFAALASGVALWVGGAQRTAVWIFIGIMFAFALGCEIFDRVLGHGRDKG